MSLTVAQWHQRFTQQATWTRQLRSYLYTQAGIESNCRVLEVGCGTGALAADFSDRELVTYIGLDVDFSRLFFAQSSNGNSQFLSANAYGLPFENDSFDFVISHYLMLWLSDPMSALREMVRVVRSSGAVLALAEPDYSSRIDEPPSLIPLGNAQTNALMQQGANPMIGRSLPRLFNQAGLTSIRFGSPGFQSNTGRLPDGQDLEWQMLEHDLSGSLSSLELSRYQALDRQAWLDGSRVLWVPTFYAIGIKKPKYK